MESSKRDVRHYCDKHKVGWQQRKIKENGNQEMNNNNNNNKILKKKKKVDYLAQETHE